MSYIFSKLKNLFVDINFYTKVSKERKKPFETIYIRVLVGTFSQSVVSWCFIS